MNFVGGFLTTTYCTLVDLPNYYQQLAMLYRVSLTSFPREGDRKWKEIKKQKFVVVELEM